MKYFTAFLFLTIVQLGFGQVGDAIAIPGTKCRIVAPEGFEIATNFTGLQNNSNGASIMINELPTSYMQMRDQFTKEALLSRGMTMTGKTQVAHNGTMATLISITQPSNGTIYQKQMLMFGDANRTVMINGIYPEEVSETLAAAIKKALLSVTYDMEQEANGEAAAPFEIDVTGTDYKFANNFTGSLTYNTTGVTPSEGPSIIVALSIGFVDATDKKKYAMSRLLKLPGFAKATVRSTEPITVDGIEGYEIVADDKQSGEIVYQMMLFYDDSQYAIFLGLAEKDETAIADFKRIARTFKVK